MDFTSAIRFLRFLAVALWAGAGLSLVFGIAIAIALRAGADAPMQMPQFGDALMFVSFAAIAAGGAMLALSALLERPVAAGV